MQLGSIKEISYKGYNICTNYTSKMEIEGYIIYSNDLNEKAVLPTMAECRNYIDMATQHKEFKGQIISMLLWSLVIYLITFI